MRSLLFGVAVALLGGVGCVQMHLLAVRQDEMRIRAGL